MSSPRMPRRPDTTPIPTALPGALLALALLLVSMVSLRAAVELDIPIHAAGYGTAFFEETARQFEALRPGVRVHVYGDPRMAEKLRIRAIGGDLPDATTAELPWPKLVASGRVLDLSPLSLIHI